MKFESYIAKQSKEERDLGPEPKERLATIINKPLTPENINSYFDEALNETADLAERVRKTYEHIRRHPQLATAHVEDRAFSHFGLQAIPQILDLITKKHAELDEVNVYMREHTTEIPEVILPPEGGGSIQGESDTYEAAGIKNRLKTLLYVLKDEGLDLDQLRLTKGQVTSEMVRQTSYVSVEIPPLNRLALICDEEGNASYMFDFEKVREKFTDPSLLFAMTKDELMSALVQTPGLGKKFIYRENWTSRVRELLHETLSQEQPERRQKPQELDPSQNIPAVSQNELDPWRGFWTDPNTGEHFGSANAIEVRLGLSNKSARMLINEKGDIAETDILDLHNHQTKGYSFEQVQQYYETEFRALPKAEEIGEWRGFFLKDGHHIGGKKTIAKRLGLVKSALVDAYIQKHELTPVPMLNVRNTRISGYSFETVQSGLVPFLALPKAENTGEWRGFVVQDGKHYAPLNVTRLRLNLTRNTVRKIRNETQISSITMRTTSGTEEKGYAIEDVEPFVKDFVKNNKE